MTATEAYGKALAQLIAWVSKQDPPQMFWLEGPDRESVRRPLDRLQVHLASDDPRFDALFESRAALWVLLGAVEQSAEDVPLDGKHCCAELPGGHPFEIHFERMSLLAKRSRAVISPQVDKTGQLRAVLDYGNSPIPDRLIS